MIVDRIDRLPLYLKSKQAKLVVSALSCYRGAQKGDYKIDEQIVLKKVYSKTKKCLDAKIESHNHHIDIQIPLSEDELYYVYDVGNLIISKEDEQKDVIYYENSSEIKCKIWVKVGEFIWLDPNEVHQPQIALDEIHDIEKIVFKVDVEK